jgi:hypothetical protein
MVLTYKYLKNKDEKENHDVIYLVNSKDNSYFAKIVEKDNDNYSLEFLDPSSILIKTNITKSDFAKGTIIIDCDNVYPYSNPYKYQTDNYAFTSIKDTILDGMKNKYYSFQCVNKKRQIKKKIGENLYIIDSTISCKPMLTFCTAYEEWKLNKNLPDGLLKELHFYNYKGSLITSEKLSHYETIIKKIIIPKCQ